MSGRMEELVADTIHEGKVAIRIELCLRDSRQRKEPLYVLLPRGSFLFLPDLTKRVCVHFGVFVTAEEAGPWFSSHGTAIKWSYPVGALFDHYCRNPSSVWGITAHIKQFPNQEILDLRSESSALAHYRNTIKEAGFLLHRSTQTVSTIRESEWKQVWDRLNKGDTASVSRFVAEISPVVESMQRVPIRLGIPSATGLSVLSRPTPLDENERLCDTMQRLFPDTKYFCHIQGIQPHAETPIVWLYQTMRSPDGFLYLILFEDDSGDDGQN